MGTLPNQTPNPYPNPNSNPNPNLSPNPAPGPKHPSFEEVSKLFTLPLSDAADSLGICPTVLKKVCYDNGLVRWPYRKFLSGKNIEEIKKDAAVEKEKKLAESIVAGEGNVSLASQFVPSSLGPKPVSRNTGSLQASTASRMPTQPQTIHNQFESSQSLRNKGNDEFKYGFPTDGLSDISYRWWGSKSPDRNFVDSKKGGSEDADKTERQPEELEDTTAANLTSLIALRSKGAKDGQRALKLGVYKGYGVRTLDRAKESVLLQIFRSSFPGNCGDMSVET